MYILRDGKTRRKLIICVEMVGNTPKLLVYLQNNYPPRPLVELWPISQDAQSTLLESFEVKDICIDSHLWTNFLNLKLEMTWL